MGSPPCRREWGRRVPIWGMRTGVGAAIAGSTLALPDLPSCGGHDCPVPHAVSGGASSAICCAAIIGSAARLPCASSSAVWFLGGRRHATVGHALNLPLHQRPISVARRHANLLRSVRNTAAMARAVARCRRRDTEPAASVPGSVLYPELFANVPNWLLEERSQPRRLSDLDVSNALATWSERFGIGIETNGHEEGIS